MRLVTVLRRWSALYLKSAQPFFPVQGWRVPDSVKSAVPYIIVVFGFKTSLGIRNVCSEASKIPEIKKVLYE